MGYLFNLLYHLIVLFSVKKHWNKRFFMKLFLNVYFVFRVTEDINYIMINTIMVLTINMQTGDNLKKN